MKASLSKYLFYYPVTYINGERIHKYLGQYEKFQYYPRSTIDEYQFMHMKKLLSYAYTNTTFYKELYDKAGVHPGSFKTLDDIGRFPLLEKHDLAEKMEQITVPRSSIFLEKKTTGGSTGQAVTLLKNADALARERAATWRAYKWAQVPICAPQARFWGVPLHVTQRIKARLVDYLSNRIRLSAFEVNERQLEKYFDKLTCFKPTYLYGYVAIIEEFSRFVADKGYKLPDSVKSVITTSEVLTSHARETIEKSLGIKVYNEYGCGEVGSIAHECESGCMHIMEDNLYLEILKGSSSESSGEIVVTDLFNYATPIIRYRLGDFASISKGTCGCGRTLGMIGNIHGRAYDCIRTKEGNSFHPELVMYIFEDIKKTRGGIERFQVVQEQIDSIRIRIVKGERFDKSIEEHISRELEERLASNMDITYEYVDSIPRDRSGKMRLVQSNIGSHK